MAAGQVLVVTLKVLAPLKQKERLAEEEATKERVVVGQGATTPWLSKGGAALG